MCNYYKLLFFEPGDDYIVNETLSPIKKNACVISEVLTVVEMLVNLYRTV
jgi:hypothetical protein